MWEKTISQQIVSFPYLIFFFQKNHGAVYSQLMSRKKESISFSFNQISFALAWMQLKGLWINYRPKVFDKSRWNMWLWSPQEFLKALFCREPSWLPYLVASRDFYCPSFYIFWSVLVCLTIAVWQCAHIFIKLWTMGSKY